MKVRSMMNVIDLRVKGNIAIFALDDIILGEYAGNTASAIEVFKHHAITPATTRTV